MEIQGISGIFTPTIRKNGSDLNNGTIVSANWAAFSVSIASDDLGFSCKTVSIVYTEWCNKE